MLPWNFLKYWAFTLLFFQKTTYSYLDIGQIMWQIQSVASSWFFWNQSHRLWNQSQSVQNRCKPHVFTEHCFGSVWFLIFRMIFAKYVRLQEALDVDWDTLDAAQRFAGSARSAAVKRERSAGDKNRATSAALLRVWTARGCRVSWATHC